LGVSESLAIKVKKLLKGINQLKTVRSKAQNQRNRLSLPKDKLVLHCEVFSEGEQLTMDSYQALLCQHMLPWLSVPYPDQT
jgi:hypothetical protein